MRVTNIILNTEQISNNTGEGLLIGVKNGCEYVNGKATDNIITQNYTIVFPENGYEKIVVKIKGDKPVITNEQIQAKNGQVKVRLKNLTGRFYRTNNGDYALTANADGIEVIG